MKSAILGLLAGVSWVFSGGALGAAVVNDGSTVDNLEAVTSANSGFDASVSVTPILRGDDHLLEARMVDEGVLFFPYRAGWLSATHRPTGLVYSVSAEFKPGAASGERRGGVIGWYDEGNGAAKGLAFYIRPGTVGTDAAGFVLARVDFQADDDGGAESTVGLYHVDGTPATSAVGSALGSLEGYDPALPAWVQLSFAVPTAADVGVLTGVTARVTGRVFQGGVQATNQVGGIVELLTDLPAPGAGVHRVGYFGYWGSVFGTGLIGEFDDLTVDGQVGGVANELPMVRLTAPTNGTVTTQSELDLAAEVADADGEIRRVEFYNGFTLIGTVTSAPYVYTWLNPPLGVARLRAVAVDDRGGMGESTNAVTVTVNANVPPTVRFLAPTAGAQIDLNTQSRVEVRLEAADSDDELASVALYGNGELLQTFTGASPLVYEWPSPAVGRHVLTAVATDTRGATNTVAASVSFTANFPPGITMVAPAAGAEFTALAVIDLQAVPVRDAVQVEFLANGVRVGARSGDLAAGQVVAFEWVEVAAGNYTLSARVVDALGASALSAEVTIVVKPSGPVETPPLSIASGAGGVTISWAAGATGFVLQSSPGLESPVWTTVPGVSNNRVTVAAEGRARFFKLTR